MRILGIFELEGRVLRRTSFDHTRGILEEAGGCHNHNFHIHTTTRIFIYICHTKQPPEISEEIAILL
jgi:hypothetical protein